MASEEDFIPLEKHEERHRILDSSNEELGQAGSFTKEEILAYLQLCHKQAEVQVTSMDLTAKSGFDWLPFDKLELQFYNIRHLQQHTGELCERLGATGDIEIGWVGRKPD